jgi:DNA-binding CsgD family transcriptional regulator
MAIWKEAQLLRLTQGEDIQSIFEVALNLTREMGFEYCAFALSPHSPVPQTQTIRINNYPTEWNKKYETHNYAAQDPLLKHCSLSVLPILWNDDAFSTFPAFREEKQSYGMCHGWSQSVHDGSGFFSMLSLTRNHQSISSGEFYEKAGHFIWLAHALHSVVAKKLLPAVQFRPESRLSTRETEVLKWSADGKTASDIATILNLSERTVNFHVSSAIKKLGVNNKISAVVHAAKGGWL